MEKTIHQGRNLKRFREMLGVKQEGLAYELGEEWNQKKISMLESKERIDTDILEQVSAILKIPVEAFQKFDEEKAVVNIQNNYQGANSGNGTLNNNANYTDCTFNPIDKLVQLHEEKIVLYERMLKEKEDMMARLERLFVHKGE